MEHEIYKPIPNYEGLYEISNFYNVKSLSRKIKRGKYNAYRNCKEKILRQSHGSVGLCKEGKRKTFDVNTLYKIVFDNYIPDGKRKINLIKNNEKILVLKKRQVCQIVKYLHPRKRDITGVGKSGGYYRADIHIARKDIYLGTFESKIDASIMYKLACENEKLYQGNAKDFRIMLNSILLKNTNLK